MYSNVRQCASTFGNVRQCLAMCCNVVLCQLVGKSDHSRLRMSPMVPQRGGTFLRPDQTDFSQTHFQCSKKACKLTVFEDWRFSLSQTQMRGLESFWPKARNHPGAISRYSFFISPIIWSIFSHIGVLSPIFPIFKKRRAYDKCCFRKRPKCGLIGCIKGTNPKIPITPNNCIKTYIRANL